MSATAEIKLETRERIGTAECRRLRKEGLIPGVIYGHGEDPVAFKIRQEDLNHFLNSGQRVLDFSLGSSNDTAILHEIQWDTFGIHILHVDLLRVKLSERVTDQYSSRSSRNLSWGCGRGCSQHASVRNRNGMSGE